MVLKDIAKGTYENAIKDKNKRNINDTYQEKLGIGTFTGNIDRLGDGGLPYTSSICWCDSSKVSGSLPYYGSTKYWFVLETNEAIDDQKSSIRSQKATIWLQDGNRVFERIFTNGEWYAWKEYLRTDGDLKDTTVSFTSGDDLNPTGWTAIGKIFSGARLKDILNGFSTGIKNLRFLYKLIGTTDISKIGDGTLTGIVNSLNTDIQNSTGYVSRASGIAVEQGWYRIARSKGHYGNNSCVISLKRTYNAPAPEYQKIQFFGVYNLRKFVSLAAFSRAHMWVKIRETWDEANDISYLEIFQNVKSSTNLWLITLTDAKGPYTDDWIAIAPTLTSETVTDTTVLASLDLPANNPA